MMSCHVITKKNYEADQSPSLQWRHNGRDGVSNHQPHDCLLNRLFRRRSKKTSKLRVTGEFTAKVASNAENVSIWWRHHVHTPSTNLQLRENLFPVPVSAKCVGGGGVLWWRHGLLQWRRRLYRHLISHDATTSHWLPECSLWVSHTASTVTSHACVLIYINSTVCSKAHFD